MNADSILDALGMIDDEYIAHARNQSGRQDRSLRYYLVLAAGIVALLALCGLAAFELGLFDPWLQRPSTDPTKTVRSAIENQVDKEYTISVRVDDAMIDEAETKRIRESYSGSELAKARGWTDKYLEEHFVVVRAKYYVRYDHSKTFMSDGDTEQYFYLTQDERTGKWTIVDNTSPSTQ